MRSGCSLVEGHRVSTFCFLLAIFTYFYDVVSASSQLSASTVQWQGTAESLAADCNDGSGHAAVSLTAGGLPASFASLTTTCNVVPWELFSNAKDSGLEGDTPESASLRDELLREIENASHSLATLTPLVSLGGDAAGGSSSANESSYLVDCQISALPSAFTIVLVAQNASGTTILVPPSSAVSQSSLDSVAPLLGPASGSTNVTIQGTALESPAVCTFSNDTESISVTALVLNSTTMICASPAWSILGGTQYLPQGESEPVSLLISAGGCAVMETFQYYSDPQVVGVSPGQGPRYGSFAFTVSLGYSLHSFGNDGLDSIQPAIRIKGGDVNGSDLILSANLTADRMALMATTPAERTPLAIGNHPVHVSLNGQQFADVLSVDTTVLTVKGPTLSIAQPYYAFSKGQTVELGVILEGENTLPVSVDLTAELRTADSTAQNNGNDTLGLIFSLNQTSLFWGPEETGLKTITLGFMGTLAVLSQGGVVVSLVSPKNADISHLNSSSVVSAMSQDQLTVSFEVEPDQVVYRGDNASIPIIVHNALMRLPATIEYEIVDLYGEVPAYLSKDQQSGVLAWDYELGDTILLDLDIQWHDVEYFTEDHLLVRLGEGWSARALGDQDSVALHVFGVEEGQCPPGTFRFSQRKAAAPGPSVRGFQSSAGWLSSIRVQDSSNWFFDLSSPFQPDVPEYGVILPVGAEEASLCLEAKHEYSVITVRNSEGQIMQQDIEITPSQSATPTSYFATGGRKALSMVAADAPAPHGGPLQANTLGEPGHEFECSGATWILPLLAGQNVFSITHGNVKVPPPTPVGAPGKKHASLSTVNTLASQMKVSPSAAASQDMAYSLSIVSLADPTHAEILELNVTAANTTIVVCTGVESRSAAGQDAGYWDLAIPVCAPSSTLHVNVSYESAIISLHPSLRFPNVQNTRVEVAGQVLSQGGNVGADQLADTSDLDTERSNAGFLPTAYIVGLQPGMPVDVPILVVAEDGVTSNRYYLSVYRDLPSKDEEEEELEPSPPPEADDDGSSVNDFLDVTLSLATELDSPPPPALIPVTMQAHASWPVAPSRQPYCHVCPAGWATTTVDQTHCNMCVPGSYAALSQSPVCTQCNNGSYTNSWGSTSCNHCIMGTYAPFQGSRLCYMCPENLTNLEDGSSGCDVPVQPGTNLLMRYAVIVSFGVYLNGTSLGAIASKVGVNASSTTILERLVGLDTATAFNITARDVNVTSIQQISRRVLLLNVTATIGLDLPTNSSDDDIQAQLELKNLSADDAIQMLSSYPDKFLARTTKALDVTATQGNSPTSRVESRPQGVRDGHLPWYAILLILLASASVVVLTSCIWRKRGRGTFGCWPRRQRAYGEFVEEGRDAEESDQEGAVGNRRISTLTSRNRNASVGDHLPILNQITSSDSIS